MPPKKVQEIIDKQHKYTDKEFLFGGYMQENNVPFPTENPEATNPFHISATRTALNTAVVCNLLNQGKKFADIMDPNKLQAERNKAAKEVSERFIRGDSNDKKWFCDTFTGGCEKVIQVFDTEIPKLANEKPTAIFEDQYAEVFYAMSISKDISQEMVHFTDVYDNEHGEGAMKALKARKENANIFVEPAGELLSAINNYYSINHKYGLGAKKCGIMAEYISMNETKEKYKEYLDSHAGEKPSEIPGVNFAEIEARFKVSVPMSENSKKINEIMKDSNADQVAEDIITGEFFEKADIHLSQNKDGMYMINFDKAEEYTKEHPAYDITSDLSKKFVEEGKEKLDNLKNVIKNVADGLQKGGDYAVANPEEALSRILAEYIHVNDVYTNGSDLRFDEDIQASYDLMNNEKAIAQKRNSEPFKDFMKKVTPERFAGLLENGEIDSKKLNKMIADYRNSVTKFNDRKMEAEKKAAVNDKARFRGIEATKKMLNEDMEAMRNISNALKEADPDKQLADPMGAKKRVLCSAFAHHVLKTAIGKTSDAAIINNLLDPDTINKSIADLENSPKMAEFIKTRISDEALAKIAEGGVDALSKTFNDFVNTLKAPEQAKNNENQIQNQMPQKQEEKAMDEQVLGQ